MALPMVLLFYYSIIPQFWDSKIPHPPTLRFHNSVALHHAWNYILKEKTLQTRVYQQQRASNTRVSLNPIRELQQQNPTAAKILTRSAADASPPIVPLSQVSFPAPCSVPHGSCRPNCSPCGPCRQDTSPVPGVELFSCVVL